MASVKPVTVELPGPLVWKLWDRAEKDGVPVEHVIRDALVAEKELKHYKAVEARESKAVRLVRRSTTDSTHAQIVRMVESGFDDGRISVAVDRTRAYVAQVRRKYGLKPNRRK